MCAFGRPESATAAPKRAPAGSKVEVSDTAAHLKALTAAQITALPGMGVSGLFISNNANVSYNVAQTTAIIASGITVAAAGARHGYRELRQRRLSGVRERLVDHAEVSQW